MIPGPLGAVHENEAMSASETETLESSRSLATPAGRPSLRPGSAKLPVKAEQPAPGEKAGQKALVAIWIEGDGLRRAMAARRRRG